MDKAAERPEVNYVVLPTVINKDKKPCLRLAPIDNTEDELWFVKGKSLGGGMHVGHVYSIPTAIEGTKRILSFGFKKWVGEFTDKSKTLAWQAAEKGLDATLAARAREKRESSDASALEAALKPIAQAYSEVPYPHRLAFEVWVLSVLRRG